MLVGKGGIVSDYTAPELYKYFRKGPQALAVFRAEYINLIFSKAQITFNKMVQKRENLAQFGNPFHMVRSVF